MKNNIKNPGIFNYLFCMLILYIYIYSPALQVMSFGLDKIVFIFSALYLFMQGKFKGLFQTFHKEWVYLFLIVTFSLLVMSFHRGFKFEGILMYDVFLFAEVILIPYALYCFFVKQRGIKMDRVLVDNAIIASLISVALLANPAWAEIMKSQILRIPELLLTNFNFRGFGFSDGLTFSYPVVQGFCAAFVIAGMIKNNPMYFFGGILPILVSVFVNARSGLIPIFLAVCFIVLKSSFVKTIKIIVTGLFLIIIGSVVLYTNTDSQLAESVKWGLTTFDIIGDMLSGREAENADALFHNMIEFPHTFREWIIGNGYNIYSDIVVGYNQSDIGFCIRTVYGGIFYMILWFNLWITMFIKAKRVNTMLAWIMFGSLIYLNWKGDFFVINPSCRFFFLVYVFCIVDSNFLCNKKIV